MKSHDVYTTALITYALSKMKSDYAGEFLRKLKDFAISKNGVTFWSLNENAVDVNSDRLEAAEVEITSYALLSYIEHREISEAMPIVRWLSLNRNILGGFRTTQDTCIALKARVFR